MPRNFEDLSATRDQNFRLFSINCLYFPPIFNLIGLDVVLCAVTYRFAESRASAIIPNFLETDKYLRAIVRASCGNFQINIG